MSRRFAFKPASLDLIAAANGQPTGDELRAQAAEEQRTRTEAEKAMFPNTEAERAAEAQGRTP